MTARNTKVSIHTEVRFFPTEWFFLAHSPVIYIGKHALGDRARKIDQGILITRFELPFNIWWYIALPMNLIGHDSPSVCETVELAMPT